MSRVLCCSVRLQALVRVSGKCFKARSFDGSEDFIPASQVFGMDTDVMKSDAYWISQWILERKSIQWSNKKQAWFDAESGAMLPTYTIEKHEPPVIEVKHVEPDNDLMK